MHGPHTYMRVIFLVLAFLVVGQPFSLAQVRPSATVSGFVYDDATGNPVQDAHIFVANSILGTTTDARGRYVLSGLSIGSYEIVVSAVGYKSRSESLRITEQGNNQIIFRLESRVYDIGEIEVTASLTAEEQAAHDEAAQTRRRQMEQFEKFFLGVSPNASKCTITNPEVLVFEEDEERAILRATALDALEIDNQALGYRLRFVLDEFEVREDIRDRYVKYNGKVGFTELTSESRRQERRWAKERERAYNGSQRHFLTALVNNRLWEEGYMLLKEGQEHHDYSGIPGARPADRVIGVEPREVVHPGNNRYERTLDFEGYLKVIYVRGIPDDRYLDFKQYAAGWRLKEDEEQQISWLSLTGGPVEVNERGIVLNQYGLTKLGYWFFDRVAEFLPYEYQPIVESPFAPQLAEAPIVLFKKGKEAIQEGDLETAAATLRAVYDSDPGFYHDQEGSAAYWLGQVYEKVGQRGAALDAYEKGGEALFAREQYDPQLMDAYITNVFDSQDEASYEPAVDAYMTLLEELDPTISDRHEEVWRNHLRSVAPMLAEEHREEMLHESFRGYLQPLPWKDDAGPAVAAWWRAQDPLPATLINERVVEHLQRLAYARQYFAESQVPLGYDDRGIVYVQYGRPRNKTVVQTDLRESRRILQTQNAGLPGPMVTPSNEFWTYRHIDEALHFLFLLKGGRYQISSPEDMIPAELRNAHQRIGRRSAGSNTFRVDEAFATALLAAWRTIYTDLALLHPEFEEQLQELDIIDSDIRASGGNASNIGSEISQDPLAGRGGIASGSFTTGLEAKFSNAAHVAAIRREEEAPRNYTRILADLNPLPVAARVARFLEPNGETRTEVFWSHIPGTLSLLDIEDVNQNNLPDDFLISMTMQQREDAYLEGPSTMLRYIAKDLPRGSEAAIQNYNLRTTSPLYHLSLQWDQQFYTREDTLIVQGETIKTGVFRRDSLTTLSTAPGRLEMSDLKPVLIDGVDLSNPDQPAMAYPFLTYSDETPLGLYFEVYELAYGADDLTRFTATYEIDRDRNRRRDRRTTASSSYTTTDRTAREYIALDLSEVGGSGSFDIILTIRDDVSGQEVSRSVQFNLSR